MNKKIEMIKDKYKEIINKSNGSSIYKMDLHIHTPYSLKDYKFSKKLDKDYDDLSFKEVKEYAIENKYLPENKIKFYEEKFSINKEDLTAILIVKRAVQKNINLIVIADHNNINGYKKIKEAVKIVNPNIPFDVIPGSEITVFGGYHLIGIFDPELDKYIKQWEKVKERLDWSIEEGKSGLATSKSLLDAIKIIKDVGGITYIPHLDSNEYKYRDKNNKKDEQLCKGQTWIKVLNDNKLDLIGANNKNILPYDKIDSDKLPIISDSDAHCIEDIGSKFAEIKMQYPSFEHLKMSLLEKTIRFKENRKEPENRIIGLAIKEGFLGGRNNSWQIFPLNSDLNCIIGGRGVGKSTLIKYIVEIFKKKIKKEDYCFLGQAKYVLIYFILNGKTYCLKGELKPIFDDYTKEWGVERKYRNRKFINIENELTLYKIKNSKDKIKVNYVSDKIKKENILKELRIESYFQTEIKSIGEDSKKINYWFEKFIKDREKSYSKLIKEEKIIIDELNKIISKFFNNKRPNKDLLLKIEDFNRQNNQINKKKKSLYQKNIKSLNSVLTKNIIIEINEQATEKINLLNYYDNIIRKSSFLNYEQENILLNHYDYFIKMPYIELILKLKNEKWKDIIRKTNFEIIGNSDLPHKAIEWNEEKIIKLFKKVFFSNKPYKKSYSPINLKISLNVNSYKKNNGKIYRPLSKLSYGQRAIVVLTIILEGFTKLGDNSPLIIDQPEDQLDNAFISNYLVKTIRNIKGERQIILTTHNPNIPIGGDAENTFCLQSNGKKGEIYKNGSIDKSNIISFIIENMEGGKMGLEMRLKKYLTTNAINYE